MERHGTRARVKLTQLPKAYTWKSRPLPPDLVTGGHATRPGHAEHRTVCVYAAGGRRACRCSCTPRGTIQVAANQVMLDTESARLHVPIHPRQRALIKDASGRFPLEKNKREYVWITLNLKSSHQHVICTLAVFLHKKNINKKEKYTHTPFKLF